LGLNSYAPSYNIQGLSPLTIESFLESHYTPDRIVIVATGGGAQHSVFLSLLEDDFHVPQSRRDPNDLLAADFNRLLEFETEEEKTAYLQRKVNPPNKHPSKYVGGEILVPADTETYLALGFHGVSWSDPDIFASGVLQYLLGGVRSGATNFPGSGLTSRLHRNFVQQNNTWIQEATSFNFNYTDSGLFGIFAIADRHKLGELVDVLVKEINSLFENPLDVNQVARARALFKGDILFSTEKRPGLVEFLGTQVISKMTRSPEEFAKSIDAVDVKDVLRVAKRIFSSKPTIAVIGPAEDAPLVSSIQQSISTQ